MSSIKYNAGIRTTRFPRTTFSFNCLLALACCTVFFSCVGFTGIDRSEVKEAVSVMIYPARWYEDHTAACSLTFDDGTLDQYAVAAPELDKRNIRGTFFVITGCMDRGVWLDGSTPRRLFSWDQARDLVWRGHEVASHTVDHIDLAANPSEADEQLAQSQKKLLNELPWQEAVSLGWPYWRSSDTAAAAAKKLYIAARAGGTGAGPDDWFYGGVNGASPQDFFHIGARGVLSSDGEEDLLPVLEEVYSRGGWLVPNFHGVYNGAIESSAVGWEALSVNAFCRILDILKTQNIWFAPFGEVARYIQQRDSLKLKLSRKENEILVDYSSALDPEIYTQPLTLVVEGEKRFRIKRVHETEQENPLAFTRQPGTELTRYLINIPPGNGVLRILIEQAG